MLLHKKTLFFILFVFFTGIVFSQSKKGNLGTKAKIEYLKADARNKFLDGDKQGAMTKYKEVINLDKKDHRAHFRMAEILYFQMSYERALNHLNIARKNGESAKDLNYWYGMLHFSLKNLDSAELYFEKILNSEYEQIIKNYYIDTLIKRVQFAKQALSDSMNVGKTLLPRQVNSRNNDYGMVYSPNENKLYFSSRRQGSKGGYTAFCIDYEYYSDIYSCSWNESEKTWKMAEQVSGKMNTDYFDDVLAISYDGNELYTYKRDGCNLLENLGDIYVSKRNKKGNWTTPKPLNKNINSDYWESSVAITQDGNTMYFISERPKGFGDKDIYKVTRTDKSDWGEPINLGPVINTAFSETTVSCTPSGDTIFFSSTGHPGMGGYDVYMSVKLDGDAWSIPVNLGYPINTVWDDVHFIISPDRKKAYIDYVDPKEGMGKLDIYELDLSKYKFPEIKK